MHIPKLYPILLPCENQEVPGFDAIGDDIYVNSLFFKGYPTGVCFWKEHQVNESAMEYESTLDLITPINKQAPCKIVYVNSAHGSGLAYGPEETGAGTYLNPFINLNSVTDYQKSCSQEVYTNHPCDFPMIAVIVSGIVDYSVIVQTRRNVPILLYMSAALVYFCPQTFLLPFLRALTPCYIINMYANWVYKSGGVSLGSETVQLLIGNNTIRLQDSEINMSVEENAVYIANVPAAFVFTILSIDNTELSISGTWATARFEAATGRLCTLNVSQVVSEYNLDGIVGPLDVEVHVNVLSDSTASVEEVDVSGCVPPMAYIQSNKSKNISMTASNGTCSIQTVYGHTLSVEQTLLEVVLHPTPRDLNCISAEELYFSSVAVTGFHFAKNWYGNVTAVSGNIIRECEVALDDLQYSYVYGYVGDYRLLAIANQYGQVSNGTVSVSNSSFPRIVGIGHIISSSASVSESSVVVTDSSWSFIRGIFGETIEDCTVELVGSCSGKGDGTSGTTVANSHVDVAYLDVGWEQNAGTAFAGIGGDTVIDCTVQITAGCTYDHGYAWDSRVIGITAFEAAIGCTSVVSGVGPYPIHAIGGYTEECHSCNFTASNLVGYVSGIRVSNTGSVVASNTYASSVTADTCCSDGNVVTIVGVTSSLYNKQPSGNYIVPCCP